jgi:Domain of unknown function (DUF1905)
MATILLLIALSDIILSQSIAQSAAWSSADAPRLDNYDEVVTFRFTAVLWKYPGDTNTWHFVTMPDDQTDEIKARTAHTRRGFGSVRVVVTVGKSTWKTSVFPAKTGNYVLPMKKQVRAAERLEPGKPVKVRLELDLNE